MSAIDGGAKQSRKDRALERAMSHLSVTLDALNRLHDQHHAITEDCEEQVTETRRQISKATVEAARAEQALIDLEAGR